MKEAQRVGFALCGSYCTYEKTFPALEAVCRRFETVIPILSEHAAATDSRFGRAADHLARAEELCRRPAITTIAGAEPIGPKKLLDVLIIAPCTGNTLAKLALGVTDSAVTMAAKAQLRNGRPVVIAVSTNDGLTTSLSNIGALLCRKHIYFVPFGQDDPAGKPASLVADMGQVVPAVEAALTGEQVQPLLLGPER